MPVTVTPPVGNGGEAPFGDETGKGTPPGVVPTGTMGDTPLEPPYAGGTGAVGRACDELPGTGKGTPAPGAVTIGAVAAGVEKLPSTG